MKKNETESLGFTVDDNEPIAMKKVDIPEEAKEERSTVSLKKEIKNISKDDRVNVLRNERIIVRHIPKETGMVRDPKHVLYGGLAEGASRTFCVPIHARSGTYVNVLTDNEKDILEEALGLEINALSIYKKKDNFWSDANENGIGKVTLYKGDNYLNLADPSDYIRYKILLANKDYIAPSLEALKNYPKPTYQFVIVSEGDETRIAKDNMSAIMKCYKEYGKVEDNIDVLRIIIETIDGRPVSNNAKLETVQTKVNNLIQANSKLFLDVITDPLLNTKVLIKKSIENGAISARGDYLYLREDNKPLCNNNEEPTLTTAARYLNNPKHQDILFALQAKLSK